MQSLPGVHERDPRVALIGFTDQEAFGRATTRQANADEPRGKHARVVDDEQIAGSKQRRQLVEVAMLDASAAAVNDHQPAAAALLRRLLRDQLVW